MAVKAQLRVQLFADSVLVAESDDHELWRSIFAAVQIGNSQLQRSNASSARDSLTTIGPREGTSAAGPVSTFAAEIGIEEDELNGACRPDTVAPYIHLDQRYWEALRSKTGSRGIDSLAPIALAATLLAAWFKHAQITGGPSLKQCQAVLATIGLRGLNPARSLKNANWLQTRHGTVQINPARWSQAMRIIKAYCLMKAPKELQASSRD